MLRFQTEAVKLRQSDAPDIDGLVHLEKPHQLKVGNFVDVRIERADDHDLYGRVT